MQKLTSIIVDYNSIEHTERAIKSLLKYHSELIEKIIVVDNYGLNEYKKLFNITDKIMVLRPNKNVGFGEGINIAMKYVNTPLVLLQNPDTIIEGKVLDSMINTLISNDKLAAVSIMAKTPEGKEVLARRFTKLYDIVGGRRSPLLRLKIFKKIGARYRYMDKIGEREPFYVDAFTGTFVLIKKEAFYKVGGFDRRYFLFMEDVDLSRKLKRAGYEIMVIPTLEIIHLTGSTRKKSSLKSGFSKAKSVYLYFIKWKEIKKIPVLFVSLLLGLYTICILFLDFIEIHRPESSWKMQLRKKHS